MHERNPSKLPDLEALIACGRRLAALHNLPPAPDDKIRAKIQEILVGRRQNYEAFKEGLLTREEVRDVLLAHMMPLIASCAEVNEPNSREDADLMKAVEAALFASTH